MKKALTLLLSLAMMVSLAACGTSGGESSQSSAPGEGASSSQVSQEESGAAGEKIDVRIAALKGPTAMGMVKMMDDAEASKTINNYQFTLAGAPDEITGKVITGEFDIAAVPTNLASVLYNKTEGKVRLLALNTLGVLYVVEAGDTVQSAGDLRGRTIYSTGKGSTPEFALNYVLAQNGLTAGSDVTVEYKSEHTELAGLLAAGQAELALLPQPFVTSVLAQNENVRVALDLTEEWNKATGGQSALTMGCVIVQADFLEQHPEAVATFLADYQASVDFVNNEETRTEAAALTEKYDIMKAAVAEQAIPQCNIVFITGDEMQKMASGFYEVLLAAEPSSVGGKLPDESFYYTAE